MKQILFLVLALALTQTVMAGIVINEIMYNPNSTQGSDSSMEWIELYNDGEALDISNWKVDDNPFDDYTISSGEFTIITRNKDAFTTYYNNPPYTVLDGSFTLSNTGDSINLSNGTTSIIIDYDSNTGGDGNGKTLEYCDGELFESINGDGTPGTENSCVNQDDPNNCDWKVQILLNKYIFDGSEDVNWTVRVSKNTGEKTHVTVRGYVKDLLTDWQLDYKPWTNTEITNYRNQKYSPNLEENKFYSIFFNITELGCNDINPDNNFNQKFIMVLPKEFSTDFSKIKITEFLPNPEGDDNAQIPGGEWVELFNQGDNPIDIKGLTLNDDFGDGLEITEVNVINTTIINPNSFLVIYRNKNGKLELDNDGSDQVILSYNGLILDSVSYSDAAEGSSYAYVEGIGWQHTKPTPYEENINFDEFKDSRINIENILDLGSDKKAKFGQTIRVKANIYKGSTTKNSVRLWAEDEFGDRISKESKTNVYTRFTNYSLTLPLQLIPNCKFDFPDGNYSLVLDGLDTSNKATFTVEDVTNDLCEEIYIDKDDRDSKKKFVYEVLYLPDKVFVGENFKPKIKITNNDEDGVRVEIWSYVYRGNKVFSGDREKNKKNDFIRPEDSSIIELSNKVTEADPGLYKFKVKIIKNDQKTAKEITRDLVVESEKGINAKITNIYANYSEEKIKLFLTIKNHGKEIQDLKASIDSFFDSKTLTLNLEEDEEKQLRFEFNIVPERNIFFIKLEKDGVLDFKKLEVSIDETGIIDLKEEEFLAASDFLEESSVTNNLAGFGRGTILTKGSEPRIIYQSTTYRAKGMVLGGLIFLLLILTIYLITRKDV